MAFFFEAKSDRPVMTGRRGDEEQGPVVTMVLSARGHDHTDRAVEDLPHLRAVIFKGKEKQYYENETRYRLHL